MVASSESRGDPPKVAAGVGLMVVVLMTNTPTTIPSASRDLQARRRLLGLTAIEVASRADLSISTLRAFEQGVRPKCSPALDRVIAVLDAAEAERDGENAAA